MEIQDIITLIQAVDEHALTELTMEKEGLKLSLKREEKAPQILNVNAAGIPAAGIPLMGAMAGESFPVAEQEEKKLEKKAEIASDQVVCSPLVGTFYLASSPEADPFVRVGDTVKKGQVLGIIEAMKLMNEIECEFDGVVEAILVGNEEVVEYGQPLFRIR